MHGMAPYAREGCPGGMLLLFKCRTLPPAILGYHLGCASGVVHGLAHNARKTANEGIAVRKRLWVADDSPHILFPRRRQRQQAVLDLRQAVPHYVQPVPVRVCESIPDLQNLGLVDC